VDIIVYKDNEFDRSRFTRSKRIQPAEEYRADFAAPEDVIIKKMEYYKEGGSDKHLRDITGILKVSGRDVDREYIITWAKKLGLMKNRKWWNARKKTNPNQSTLAMSFAK
jgi:hypothetical protein